MIKRLGVVLLVLLIAGAMIVTTSGLQASQANLSCEDLSKCTGLASCGESGETDGCTLKCGSNKAHVECGEVSPYE